MLIVLYFQFEASDSLANKYRITDKFVEGVEPILAPIVSDDLHLISSTVNCFERFYF